ncbi:hypothetical protein [Nitrobacter vulgaris]|uniref:hypothetical protein n=1 Tax=Nitrobacter vulgaris TaxID=29421 RepID=UPI00286C0017|nr:hypothetical protein [Nitrobacter vulgaris]
MQTHYAAAFDPWWEGSDMKKKLMMIATAATLGSALAVSAPAQAQRYGPGLGVGLAAGAVAAGAAAGSYYGPYGYYGGGPYHGYRPIYYGSWGGYPPSYYGGFAPVYYGGWGPGYFGGIRGWGYRRY